MGDRITLADVHKALQLLKAKKIFDRDEKLCFLTERQATAVEAHLVHLEKELEQVRAERDIFLKIKDVKIDALEAAKATLARVRELEPILMILSDRKDSVQPVYTLAVHKADLDQALEPSDGD